MFALGEDESTVIVMRTIQTIIAVFANIRRCARIHPIARIAFLQLGDATTNIQRTKQGLTNVVAVALASHVQPRRACSDLLVTVSTLAGLIVQTCLAQPDGFRTNLFLASRRQAVQILVAMEAYRACRTSVIKTISTPAVVVCLTRGPSSTIHACIFDTSVGLALSVRLANFSSFPLGSAKIGM